MTPFNTALQVAGTMNQSTPKAILPKRQPQIAPQTTSPIAKKPSRQNAQVAAYSKAMNSAIKNTKIYR